jgi:hypothetical protein
MSTSTLWSSVREIVLASNGLPRILCAFFVCGFVCVDAFQGVCESVDVCVRVLNLKQSEAERERVIVEGADEEAEVESAKRRQTATSSFKLSD